MKIGFDVDGVLADFIGAFGDVARKLYGERVPVNFVPTDWNFGNLLTKEELHAVWKAVSTTENFWQKERVLPGVKDSLTSFFRINRGDVWFITARKPGAGATVAKQTQRWLDSLGVNPKSYCGVISVDHPEHKKAMLQAMGLQYFIDDHGPTIEELDTIEGLNAYLLDAPWNQDAKVKNRVSDLNEYLSRIHN